MAGEGVENQEYGSLAPMVALSLQESQSFGG
jgi:hypothetical protein